MIEMDRGIAQENGEMARCIIQPSERYKRLLGITHYQKMMRPLKLDV